MNIDQAKQLLAACAAFDNRQPSLIAARAWAKSLEDMPLDQDAFDAVAVFYGTPPADPRQRPWIQPHDVRAIRTRLREKRLENYLYEPPQADRDPAYLQRLRSEVQAIADRRAPAPTERLALSGGPHPSVAERMTWRGQTVPVDEPEPDPEAVAQARAIARAAGIYGIECPTCQAPVGHKCRRGPLGKHRPNAHPDRRRAAAGELPSEEERAAREAEMRRRQEASRAALAELGHADGEAAS